MERSYGVGTLGGALASTTLMALGVFYVGNASKISVENNSNPQILAEYVTSGSIGVGNNILEYGKRLGSGNFEGEFDISGESLFGAAGLIGLASLPRTLRRREE